MNLALASIALPRAKVEQKRPSEESSRYVLLLDLQIAEMSQLGDHFPSSLHV